MGVDFQWSGSASYPRYYEEVQKIATQCFGAVLNEQFVKDEQKVEKSLLNPEYMFGSVHERDDKFTFPEGTPEEVVKFCQKPVGKFYDAKKLWEAFQVHPEIEEISDDIWNEVKTCALYNESYHVS
ncbi:MAG: hypothetical protein IKT27_04565 [Clostridia bacterium]|nr:hypothetical protein [Clostridia bacterium]